MGISASWELGFSDYNLVVLEGDEKNIAVSYTHLTLPTNREV